MANTAFLHKMVRQYGCGPVDLAGNPRAWYERHLVLDHVVAADEATPRQQFEAIASSVRDLLTPRWLKTQQTHDTANPKQVYYLSMEFLIGRSLANNIINLQVEPLVREAHRAARGWIGESWPRRRTGRRAGQRRSRPLGRLLHRLAGHDANPRDGLWPALPIRHVSPGNQERLPGRASRQLAAPSRSLGGAAAARRRRGQARTAPSPWPTAPCKPSAIAPTPSCGIPYDRPVVGYGGTTINTLRLWEASSPRLISISANSASGDFFGAVHGQGRRREPDPRSLSRRFDARPARPAVRAGVFPGRLFAGRHPAAFPPTRQRLAHPARQGRHPAQRHASVAGRRRVDAHPARRGRTSAGTKPGTSRVRTLAYTNHTLLPEALEKWPVQFLRDRRAATSWKSSTKSIADFSTTCGRAIPATKAACNA